MTSNKKKAKAWYALYNLTHEYIFEKKVRNIKCSQQWFLNSGIVSDPYFSFKIFIIFCISLLFCECQKNRLGKKKSAGWDPSP